MKKLLVPMLEAGAGHKMPALAVKEALDRLYPGEVQVDVVDFVREVGALKTDHFLKHSWDIALAHPLLARMGYRFADSFWPFSVYYYRYGFPDFVTKAMKYLELYKPDLIFSTNYVTSIIASQARKKLNLSVPVISFVTDPFDAFGWWVDPALDRIFVASEKAKQQLLRRHIPEDKITQVAFPIQAKFSDPKPNLEVLRHSLGLEAGVPTLLSSEGGQGIGKISGFVMELYKQNYPCNIISVCGKNEELRGELQHLIENTPSRTRLIPLGFVSNMHELLALSDLCVAKAGASTMYEALLSGVPIIFTSWATYNEKPNIDYCISQGIGWYAPDFPQFSRILANLLSGSALETAKAKIKSLQLRSGSEEIARLLRSYL